MNDEDRGRTRLVELATEHGTSLAALSMDLDRSVNYLQQWVTAKEPKFLDPDDRLWLAKRFQVDETQLGARVPWRPGDD